MRKAAITLALLLLAAPLSAQDDRRPDYSRDALTRFFAQEELEAPAPRPRNSIGAIDFTAFGVPFRFNYLGTMRPLSGSEFGLGAVTQTWPDPFALTGTQIATSPRAWRTQRSRRAELRRIDRLDRRRFSVSVGSR